MRRFVLVAVLIGLLCRVVHAKAVFAHFMVSNCASWTTSDWKADIKLAQAAHLDAFALNIANGDDNNAASVANAFSAAESLGFHLFFSFDYAGGGAWDMDDVISYLNEYRSSSAYFNVDGQPLASTFEGPENAADWVMIRVKTGCFFIPDWSSAGAKGALQLFPGVVHGLFNWAAWPWGNLDMNTYIEASYRDYLRDYSFSAPLQYMMPVSPWFFTNMPGYHKNWVWRGDNLWFDRWQEVWYVQPDFVEVLTWNDYGESHYIGPLHDDGMTAFDTGKTPFNYVTDMPHDGWRQFLPYVIDMYKNGIATITQEGLTAWFRLTPKDSGSCTDGGTTGNTASQLQFEFYPADIVEDKIFYTALLGSHQSVSVTVGGVDLGASWTNTPDGGIGLYHGSVPYGGATGQVVVTVGSMVMTGEAITTSCDRADGQGGVTNWNAWVGSAAGSLVHATPALNLTEQVCIRGTGAPAYLGLCEFACNLAYCPIGACTCLEMGAAVTRPKETGVLAYPAAGLGSTYDGLCKFSCNHGYCPPTACDTVKHELIEPDVSPFNPPACIAGTGEGNLKGLCSYACNFGFCPIHSCKCTTQGALNVPPEQTGGSGRAANSEDSLLYDALCDFACSRDYCPDVCTAAGTDSSGDFLVYPDPDTWASSDPIIPCYPPCTIVLPPFTLPDPTTISFVPVTTELEVVTITATITVTYTNTEAGTTYVSVIPEGETSTTTTTVIVPPTVVSIIPFWNIPIVDPEDTTSIIILTTSILPHAVTLTNTHDGQPTSRTIHPPPWPYTGPSSTGASTKGQPPSTIAWTSAPSTATPCVGPGCVNQGIGTRCTGLFCNWPCLSDCVKNPDPDRWDPKDPNSPWPNSAPWEPEDEACTTTSASSCSTECLASGTTTTCGSTCSVSYGCSATADASTTLGTYTIAPYGYFTAESWDTASDDNPAYTRSVFASIASELDSWYPGLGRTTTAAAPPPAQTTGLGLGDTCTADSQCGKACGSALTSAQYGCNDGKCVCIKDPPPAGADCGSVDECNEWYACGSGQTMECKLDKSYGSNLCKCSSGSKSLLGVAKFYSHVWAVATTNETISGRPGWLELPLESNSSFSNGTVAMRSLW